MDDDDPNAQGNSRRHIIEQCEASLRRLQTDYIDLYQIHRPQPEIADRRDAARARRPGPRRQGALHRHQHLRAPGRWSSRSGSSKELGLNRFVCEQPPYNLLDRRIERELLPMAQTYGMGIIPWSPIAGGLLTGKYNRDDPSPEDARSRCRDNPIWSGA